MYYPMERETSIKFLTEENLGHRAGFAPTLKIGTSTVVSVDVASARRILRVSGCLSILW